jgi:transposase
MEMPIFPAGVVRINGRLAVEKKEGMVFYFNYQNPIHVHKEEDRNAFRYITASLVVSGMCKIYELAKALGVKRRNIERYSKHLKEDGMQYFFAAKHTGGKAHKITDENIVAMQELLNQGCTNIEIGKAFAISEGAVRYYIKNGVLKKSLFNNQGL